MEPIEERIYGELVRLEPVIEEITGLRSRWNGTVELLAGPDFKGKKPFSCGIVLDAALAEKEERWRTLIHELLHAVSAGYSPSDYRAMRGWEEGVVEQMQRLIRPDVLVRIGVGVPETVFETVEASHLFNRYIEALEAEKLAFYRDLLNIPIRSRPASLFERRLGLPTDQCGAFVGAFARAHAVLRG